MGWTDFLGCEASRLHITPVADFPVPPRLPDGARGRVRMQGGVQDAAPPIRRYGGSWIGITAEVVELQGPGPHLEELRSASPRLIVMLEEIGGHAELRLTPDRAPRPGHHVPNNLAVVAADTPVWEFADRFRYIRRISIDFDIDALASGDGGGAPFRLPRDSRLMFANARVWALADLLADECARLRPVNHAYGDSLALVIFHTLFGLGDAGEGAHKARALTPRQLRRVTEYMEQSAAMSVPLKDLASVAGLSQAYFSRAFKASTGMTPLRWHLTARIRSAQQVMIETKKSLAEVALTTGFADQSHFTRVFHNITGESPGAWRRHHTA